MNLNNLSVLDNLKSRSISPENFTGAKSQGGRATTGTGVDWRGILVQVGKYPLPLRFKVDRSLR